MNEQEFLRELRKINKSLDSIKISAYFILAFVVAIAIRLVTLQ